MLFILDILFNFFNCFVIGCSGSFGGTGGSFTSPNHPDFYVIANLNCTYSIKVDPAYRIYLNVSSIFGTEMNYDYLNVSLNN